MKRTAANRRSRAAGILALGAVTLSCPSLPILDAAQTPKVNRPAEKEEASLEELLTSGLKVRTKSEKEFIAKVTKLVDEGKLSDSLVKAIFQRARDEHTRYPLPYFTAILQRVAKQRGVNL